MRPQIWREGKHWRYTAPAAGGWVRGQAHSWRAALDRVNTLVRAEQARLGSEKHA